MDRIVPVITLKAEDAGCLRDVLLAVQEPHVFHEPVLAIPACLLEETLEETAAAGSTATIAVLPASCGPTEAAVLGVRVAEGASQDEPDCMVAVLPSESLRPRHPDFARDVRAAAAAAGSSAAALLSDPAGVPTGGCVMSAGTFFEAVAMAAPGMVLWAAEAHARAERDMDVIHLDTGGLVPAPGGPGTIRECVQAGAEDTFEAMHREPLCEAYSPWQSRSAHGAGF